MVIKELNNAKKAYQRKDFKAADEIYSKIYDNHHKLTTKALLDTRQYDKCINLSTEALLNLSEFTYDNDVWFKWRIAKSFNQLGEYDQSVDYLNDIKQFKNDWFIDNLMAENYFFKNDWDNALKYALSAALAKGDTDKKVNLYSLIEDILNKKNKQKEADIHAYLVYTIRKRHNWNIDENLEYKIEKAGFDLDNEIILLLKSICIICGKNISIKIRN